MNESGGSDRSFSGRAANKEAPWTTFAVLVRTMAPIFLPIVAVGVVVVAVFGSWASRQIDGPPRQQVLDPDTWKAASSRSDYDLTRFSMLENARTRAVGLDVEEARQLLGPSEGEDRWAICASEAQCSVLVYKLGYEPPPVRLNRLALVVVVIGGVVKETTVQTY